VISTALKQGLAEQSWVAAATASMTRLNRDAADALHEVEADSKNERPVHAATDVTGFGLLGHAREMAIGSGVSMKIDHKQIAYLPGAIEAARGHFFSGGMKNNRDFCESCVGFADDVSEEFRALLFDPQTSGGLFVSIAPEAADSALAAFERHKVPARAIGEIIPRRSPLIEIA
jgi:selenide,water dikinase